MPGFERSLIGYRGIVDMKVVAATAIGTTEIPGASEGSNERFQPLLMAVSVAVTGSLVVLPVFSVGYTAAAYDDFFASMTLPVGVISLTEQFVRLVKDDSISVGDGTNIVVNVTTAATTSSGSFKLKFVVLGINDGYNA